MRTKTFSALALATIALLAAAVPSFAQTQADSQKRFAAAGSGFQLALNQPSLVSVPEAPVVETKSVVASIPVAPMPMLTVAMFNSTEQFTVADNKVSSNSQLVWRETTITKDQFRADDESGVSSKRVTFVPSRIPKFPY